MQPSTNRVEKICCKVTGRSILITAERKLVKPSKAMKNGKSQKSSRWTIHKRTEVLDFSSSISAYPQLRVCALRGTPVCSLPALPLYLEVSTGQHSSALLQRGFPVCGACTYRHTCSRPRSDIINSPLKTAGGCPEGGGGGFVGVKK